MKAANVLHSPETERQTAVLGIAVSADITIKSLKEKHKAETTVQLFQKVNSPFTPSPPSDSAGVSAVEINKEQEEELGNKVPQESGPLPGPGVDEGVTARDREIPRFDQMGFKEKMPPKLGMDKESGDKLFSLSDPSRWTSDEDEDVDFAGGLEAPNFLSSSAGATGLVSLEPIHQSIMEYREETRAESRRTQAVCRKMQGAIWRVGKMCSEFAEQMGEAEA
ncbi:hypothetical protein NDU88_006313 [Pleurodeles waltl]|uniref:Uncharacterized protein n=1 Tax=Pleurodeles waltl TaxID=8319 RepID=A0AAV7WD83_PLEWA|nr:hypothetical protein NDU88_006313 [Pleurodeles waltl]